MTRPQPEPARARRGGMLSSTRLRILAGLVAVVVVGAAAYGGWYLFLRPAGPPPVDLAALPPAVSAAPTAAVATPVPGASSAPGVDATAPAGASPTAGAGASTAAGLDGAWKVDTSIGSGTTGSFVGYRVQETLAGIGANTAVGRTSSVSGTFTLQGTTITAATITSDLTGLQSDDARRDGQLSHRGLETSTFPNASFVLGKPADLGSVPAEGQIVKVTASGELTLHGQTKAVDIPLEARLSGGVIAVTGSLPIAFSDYGIQAPTSFIALSVEDHGTMELQLMFTKG